MGRALNRSLEEFTLTNYHRRLENLVTDVIPAKTPLWELKWDRGCMEKVKELVSFIEDISSYEKAFHVQKLLTHAQDYTIFQE